MTTQYYTASSLDGFIATEDHSLEWLFPLGDVNDTGYPDFVAQVGADIRFVNGAVGPVHRQMQAAAENRNIWLVGGGDLVGQFHDAGLLDEIIVQVASVTLGAGRPLLPRRITNPPLRLVSARMIGAGFAELRYAVAKQTHERNE